MTAIRLLLLLALSFQTIASLWATSDGISRFPTHSLQAHPDPLVPIDITGIDHMANEADSMEVPCELTDSETWDSASDEGLRETLYFDLAVGGSKTVLPYSEQRYNFFIRYGIPPPEAL